MRNSSLIGFVALVIAALAISGCGSDGDGGEGTATANAERQSDASGGSASSEGTISKAAFVKKADGICAAAVRKVSPDEIKSTEDFAQAAIATFKTEAEGIEELPTPTGDKGEVAEMLDLVHRSVDALEAGEGNVYKGANGLMSLAEKRAGDYGLESCWLSATE